MTNIKLSISQPKSWLQKICSVACTESVPQNLFQLVISELLDFLSGTIEPPQSQTEISLETLISLISYSMAPNTSLSTSSTVWSGATGRGKIIKFLSHGQTWKFGGNMSHYQLRYYVIFPRRKVSIVFLHTQHSYTSGDSKVILSPTEWLVYWWSYSNRSLWTQHSETL